MDNDSWDRPYDPLDKVREAAILLSEVSTDNILVDLGRSSPVRDRGRKAKRRSGIDDALLALRSDLRVIRGQTKELLDGTWVPYAQRGLLAGYRGSRPDELADGQSPETLYGFLAVHARGAVTLAASAHQDDPNTAFLYLLSGDQDDTREARSSTQVSELHELLDTTTQTEEFS